MIRVLSDGLRTHTARERSEQVLSAYKKAFNGFSEEELLVLDGVGLEPTTRPASVAESL